MRIKNSIVAVLIIVMMFALIACASWQKKATVGYEVTGATLQEIHTLGTQLCSEGKVKADDCTKLKALYNKTQRAYVLSGSALITAIETQDKIVKQASIETYMSAVNDVAKLMPELLKLATELGVLKGD